AKEPICGGRIVEALWRSDDDLIWPAAHQENSRLENSIARLGDKLETRITLDRRWASADQCCIDAFDEVIAIGFELGLAVEIETRIVINPADQVDARRVFHDEQVRRVWPMGAVDRLRLVLRCFRHEHGEVALGRSKFHPTTVIWRPRRSRSIAGRAGWTGAMFLGVEREADPDRDNG